MTIPVLDTTTVPGYIAAHPHLAALVDATTLNVIEIGDGNLNLVFVATDAQGRSLTLKQSLPYVRMVGESWPLSQDRILAEARGYEAANRLSPDTAVTFHGLDLENRTIALEDMSSWTVWRRALNDGLITEGAADAVGRYVARLAFGTSAFSLSSAELRAALAASVNPELCQITEDVVFTEPYLDHEHNFRDPELEPDALAMREGGFLDHVAELKHIFMTRSESLLHGDLHTGSVFVPPAGGTSPAKVFDIEFAFYGPVGFDLGALFANFLIAQARAQILDRPAAFRGWVANLPTEAWNGFESELRTLWPGRTDRAFTDGFLDRWLERTFHEAVGFGGIKAVRRMIGLAHASDIETLEPTSRIAASRLVLATARAWVERRNELSSTAQLIALTAAGLHDELAVRA